MNILAIIPARGGSKGLPRKNIKSLNGKPLIVYTIDEAKKSRFLTRVVVSTEDAEIAEIAKIYGAEVPFLRPMELASDYSPTIDTVLHLLNWLKENENYVPDYVCLLQCTTPLKRAEHIDGAIMKLLETEADGVVSICEAETHPFWTQVFKGDKLEPFIKQDKQMLRRQDLPLVYKLNGAIWLARTDRLIEEKSLILKNETGYIMSLKDSIDIDTIEDFVYAELLMKLRENS